MKGYTLRVGGKVLVPLNATDADIAAALAMMTPRERKRVAKSLASDLRWVVWQMKHPIFTAILSGAYQCGLAMLEAR